MYTSKQLMYLLSEACKPNQVRRFLSNTPQFRYKYFHSLVVTARNTNNKMEF